MINIPEGTITYFHLRPDLRAMLKGVGGGGGGGLIQSIVEKVVEKVVNKEVAQSESLDILKRKKWNLRGKHLIPIRFLESRFAQNGSYTPTIANGVPYTLLFNTVSINPNDINIKQVLNNGFQVSFDGTYRISTYWDMTVNVIGTTQLTEAWLHLYKNGSLYSTLWHDKHDFIADHSVYMGGAVLGGTDIIKLTTNDKIDIRLTVTVGASLGAGDVHTGYLIIECLEREYLYK